MEVHYDEGVANRIDPEPFNGWPMRAPTDASGRPSRTNPQPSRWNATARAKVCRASPLFSSSVVSARSPLSSIQSSVWIVRSMRPISRRAKKARAQAIRDRRAQQLLRRRPGAVAERRRLVARRLRDARPEIDQEPVLVLARSCPAGRPRRRAGPRRESRSRR